MTPPDETPHTVLKVIDALDHPHGNRILRTRVLAGTAPTVAELRGSWLEARGPDGRTQELRVIGFPLFGGMPTDRRIKETGRVDLIVAGGAGADSVTTTWELRRQET